MPELRASKILSIETNVPLETYDITVKKNHNFIANGFVVHNCFQEQAMILASRLGGISDQEVNVFRKLISKKPKKEDPLYKKFLELREKFQEGAVKNGLTEIEAIDLFDAIEEFAKYSFNKSHAISYSINSYICAWLLTYYPDEWLCAYVQTRSDNPNKKAEAISEIKSLGYKIEQLDISHASDRWSITGPKTLMPSLNSCKGIGIKALEELEQLRPFKSIYDFLWNEDGSFKLSKFNKKCVDVCIKIQAIKSFDVVGEGKLFSTYAQAHKVLIENWDLLRKKLKKDTFDTQVQKLHDLVAEVGDVPEWSLQEKMLFFREFTGEINLDYIISEKTQKKLYKNGYVSIEEYPDEETEVLVWFLLDDYLKKKTKTGKSYLSMSCSGILGKQERVACWNWNESHDIKRLRGYVALVKRNDFGYATNIQDMMLLPNE